MRKLHFRLSTSRSTIQRDSLEMGLVHAPAQQLGQCFGIDQPSALAESGFKLVILAGFDVGDGQCRRCEDPQSAFLLDVSMHAVLHSDAGWRDRRRSVMARAVSMEMKE